MTTEYSFHFFEKVTMISITKMVDGLKFLDTAYQISLKKI